MRTQSDAKLVDAALGRSELMAGACHGGKGRTGAPAEGAGAAAARAVRDVFGARNTWGENVLCRGAVYGASCGGVPDALAATQPGFAAYAAGVKSREAAIAAAHIAAAASSEPEHSATRAECTPVSFPGEYAVPYTQGRVALVTGVLLPTDAARAREASHGGAMLGVDAVV